MATKEQKTRSNEVPVNNAGVSSQNQLGNNPYNIKGSRFPSDLGSSDLLHYVQFAINVRGKSKFGYGKKTGVAPPPNGAQLNADERSQVKDVGEVSAGVSAGIAVSALASQIFKAKNTSGAVSKILPVIAGAATSGAMFAADVLDSDQTSRISDVISLHVDGPPTVKYGMQYSNKDLGTMAGILSGSAFNSVQGALEAGAAMGMQFAKLPGALGGTDFSTAIGAAAKVSLNPFREVIFEAVDFRTFAFKYKFLPKNKSETETIKNIITLFKFHMHPEISVSKLFFIYPSEFQITYYFKGGANEYFHKFRPCVLESMEVTYGGEQFSSFRDGQPTEVNMSLIFKETEVITKELIGAKGVY